MKDPRPRDDVFAALADELQADTGFCQAMDELEEAVAAAVPPEELAVEITQNYKSVPINDFGTTLYEAFTELCEGQGIDVLAAATQTPANYREVSEMISYLTY